MTDTAPAPPNDPDGIEFVQSGIIRFHMADGLVRVRRPFLGELRDIRLALEEVQDALTGIATEVTIEGRVLQQEATDISNQLGAGEIPSEDHAALLAEIRGKDRDAARRLEDARETRSLEWWGAHVFATLALDPVPEELRWPTWILDPSLPQKCLQHWRTVPTGPG